MIKQGDWGAVRVLTGQYKNRIGYYDADSDSGKSALVNFGIPVIGDEEAYIKHENLEKVDTSLQLEKLKTQQPEFYKWLKGQPNTFITDKDFLDR